MGKWFGVWSLETIITPLSVIEGEDGNAGNFRNDFIFGEHTQASVEDGVFLVFLLY